MDFLVTGGAGFIGRHTITALCAKYPDAEITALDNFSLADEPYLGRQVRFVDGDVRKRELVDYLVGECQPRGVIHLAADSRVLPTLTDAARAVDTTRTNVVGTANILAAIAKYNPTASLVYAGSSTAYGGNSIPNRESDLPDVQSPYAATKLAGEHLVRSFVTTFNIRATTLRYFQVYGPGQPTTGAYALVTGIFLRQYAAGEPLTIEGDGKQTRDFIHVTDVAAANVAALDAGGPGLPINIGSGEMHSVQELADLISANQVHVPARPIDLNATLADISLAWRVLRWWPTVSFYDGVADMKRAVTQSG